jgi:hypothetical protein
MTITITLRDEVENLLREKAAQRGITLDSLAMEIFNQALLKELEQDDAVILRDESMLWWQTLSSIRAEIEATGEGLIEDSFLIDLRDRQEY